MCCCPPSNSEGICLGEAVAVVHQKVYRMFSPTIFRRRGDVEDWTTTFGRQHFSAFKKMEKKVMLDLLNIIH
jgi:hypothetical protein